MIPNRATNSQEISHRFSSRNGRSLLKPTVLLPPQFITRLGRPRTAAILPLATQKSHIHNPAALGRDCSLIVVAIHIAALHDSPSIHHVHSPNVITAVAPQEHRLNVTSLRQFSPKIKLCRACLAALLALFHSGQQVSKVYCCKGCRVIRHGVGNDEIALMNQRAT